MDNDDLRSTSYTNAMSITNTITESSTDQVDEQVEVQNDEQVEVQNDEHVEVQNDEHVEVQNDEQVEVEEDKDSIEYHSRRVQELRKEKDNSLIEKLHENAYKIDEKSDKLCSWLQIFTSCFSSFAHGSNDVANAVAPLATIFSIYQYNEVREETVVPIWVLVC